MFIDYEKLFEEDEKTHCTEHLKSDGFGGLLFGVISKPFREHLEKYFGGDAVYEHYVCGECGYPSKFYVRFCYWCEHEFYGPQKAQQCINCIKEWGN